MAVEVGQHWRTILTFLGHYVEDHLSRTAQALESLLIEEVRVIARDTGSNCEPIGEEPIRLVAFTCFTGEVVEGSVPAGKACPLGDVVIDWALVAGVVICMGKGTGA